MWDRSDEPSVLFVITPAIWQYRPLYGFCRKLFQRNYFTAQFCTIFANSSPRCCTSLAFGSRFTIFSPVLQPSSSLVPRRSLPLSGERELQSKGLGTGSLAWPGIPGKCHRWRHELSRQIECEGEAGGGWVDSPSSFLSFLSDFICCQGGRGFCGARKLLDSKNFSEARIKTGS